MNRRRPLAVGQRCRHCDGREGIIVAEGFDSDLAPVIAAANPLYQVRWDTGGQDWLLGGYLEALSADKLTA